MINFAYQKGYYHRDQDEECFIKNIKGDFSDFDRIYYNWDNKNNIDSLLIFSEKKQLFQSIDPQTAQISAFELSDKMAYREVELYDGKLFCISIDPVCITIFLILKVKSSSIRKNIFCK
ncbi:hypothetical protein C823_000950 [Eubacterium plexicaudatum ASF492]|nr:hypothetical protein C823_000950 [Eubacterium plexicaudatum ASF492]